MNTKLSKKDKERKYVAYRKKVDEYNLMSLEELKTLYNEKKPGGVYLEALLQVTEHKLNHERYIKMQALSNNEVKAETIEEIIEDNTKQE